MGDIRLTLASNFALVFVATENSSKCASELGKKDHASFLLDLHVLLFNMNYHTQNVVSVIPRAVGGRPNQVTHPIHMDSK
jgi:hypothetical protein